jgi:hypothetical protein
MALLGSALLVVTIGVAPAAAGSPPQVTHTRLIEGGAWASFSEVHGDRFLSVDVGFSKAVPTDGGETVPSLWVNAQESTWDAETGEPGEPLWFVEGNAEGVAYTIARDYSSASIDVPDLAIQRCDVEWTCVEDVVAFRMDLVGVGPLMRFHQNSVSSVSRQSRFVATRTAVDRYATATIAIGDESFGPTTDPYTATIWDSKANYIEATIVPFGATAPAMANVVPYDTSAPGEGVQSGQGVFGSWTRQEDGITVDTFLSGNTRHIVGTGTTVDESQAFYNEQVYMLDEWENPVLLSETFSVEGATADHVAVDNNLRTGAFEAAAIPVVTCTYIDGEPICTETTISASAAFTGYGSTTRSMDGNIAGVAGQWQMIYHHSSTTRQATATATIDGGDPGALVEGRLDLFKQGYREITIR